MCVLLPGLAFLIKPIALGFRRTFVVSRLDSLHDKTSKGVIALKRFGDIGISAAKREIKLALVGVVGGYDNHCRVRTVRLDMLENVITADPRQHDIENNQLKRLRCKCLHCLVPVSSARDFIVRGQGEFQNLPDTVIVLDYQYRKWIWLLQVCKKIFSLRWFESDGSVGQVSTPAEVTEIGDGGCWCVKALIGQYFGRSAC